MTTPTFKRSAPLALPSYSIKDKKQDEPFFIRVDGPIIDKQQFKKDGVTPDTDEEGKEKWIHSCMVTDLVTGEMGDMVLPFIVKKAFDEYVKHHGKIEGGTFEVCKGKLKNRTNEWSVYSIVIPQKDATETAKPEKKGK